MSKRRKKSSGVAAAYAALRKDLIRSNLDKDRIQEAAAELRKFGLETNRLINDKLRAAPPEELKILFNIIPHLELSDLFGLEELLQSRNVTLELKKECFEVMNELGLSVEESFLQQFQEAEEIYMQLESLLEGGKSDGERFASLAEDLLQLPSTLVLSFLESIHSRWGKSVMLFAYHLAGGDGIIDSKLVDMAVAAEDANAVEALVRIADRSEDKQTVKRARRALYRLKERGIADPDVLAAKETIVSQERTASETESEQAFATSFDSFGVRLVVLAMPGVKDMLVCDTNIDFNSGFLHFFAGEMSKKEFRELLKEIDNEAKSMVAGSMVEIEPEHCRSLLEEAYQISKRNGSLIPEQYKSLRYRLKPDDGFDLCESIYRLLEVSDDDVRSASARINVVLDIPEVDIWLIEQEQMLPYLQRFTEISESKLVLDEKDTFERLDDALADFTSEFFSGDRLRYAVRRLEENAYILAKLGRAEEAKLVAAFAKDVAGSSFLKPHKFLQALFVRSLFRLINKLQEEDKARRRTGEGRIIRPGQV